MLLIPLHIYKMQGKLHLVDVPGRVPYSYLAEWVTPLRSHPSGDRIPPPPSLSVSRLPGGSADVALGSCLGPGSRADVTQPRGGGGSPGGRTGLLAKQDYLLPL